MKRLLFIISNFRHGGTNKSLQNLSSVLDNHLYTIDVFALEHYGPYQNSLQNCNIIKKNFVLDALFASFKQTTGFKKVLSLILKAVRIGLSVCRIDFNKMILKWQANRFTKDKYDTVIAFSEGVPTIFVSFINTKNKIAWIRCDYSSYLTLNNNPNEFKFYKTFNRIICVSEYTRFVFCKIFPEFISKTVALHNIINDTTIINASKVNCDSSIFKENNFTILSIGRLDKVKRFSEIPKIANYLKSNKCEFKWYLIGPGDNSNEQIELERNMQIYDTNDVFFWLGPKNNPYPYIKDSDLIVVTSSTEAAPNVINEAKILHIPIISANFGSASEFLKNDYEGYILPFHEIGSKIRLIIKNGMEYSRIKANLSKFTYDNRKILNQISEIL